MKARARGALIVAVMMSVVVSGGRLTAEPQNRAPTAVRVVTGKVIDSATGAAVPNARISSTVTAVGEPVVRSDAEGRFSIALAAERPVLEAFKTGYVRSILTIPSGGEIEFRLERSAAISGRITNAIGDPLARIRVTAVLVRAGQRVVRIASTRSDERGEYRLGGLAADEYAVEVQEPPRGGDRPRMVFFPGSALDGASRLVVRPGEERTSVDIALSNVLPIVEDQPPVPPASRSVFKGGRGAIRGQLLDADGHAVPEARIILITSTGPRQGVALWAESDTAGRFEFHDLPPREYFLEATKPGFFASGRSSGFQPFQAFDLADGETREFELRIAKWASLSGRVVDERGDPVSNLAVRLWHSRYELGRRWLLPVNPGAASQVSSSQLVRTNDKGEYRFDRLPFGRYLVGVNPGELSTQELPGYLATFYPGTADPIAAQPVAVAGGAELTGVDIALAPGSTVRISGTMLSADGGPRSDGSLELIPAAGAVGFRAGARIEPDGSFEFVNVSPGAYVIQLSGPRRSASVEGEFAAVPITIAGTDVTNVVVQAHEGSTVSGFITLRNSRGGALPANDAVEIRPLPADAPFAPRDVAQADIGRDWTFTMSGLTGLRRLLPTRLPIGWALEAVLVNGIDVADRPLQFGNAAASLRNVEIVLTDRAGVLTGFAADARSQPARNAVVIVYSTEPGLWYPASRSIRMVTTDTVGRFTLSGLPSGRYFATALSHLPYDDREAWQDPDYLASLRARAATVTIAESTSTSIRLEVR